MQESADLRPMLGHAILSRHQRQSRHSQKQPVFHHAHNSANLRRQHLGIVNHSARAVENVVLFICQIRAIRRSSPFSALDSVPSAASLGSTTGSAIFTTSTGSGNLPRCSTSFGRVHHYQELLRRAGNDLLSQAARRLRL